MLYVILSSAPKVGATHSGMGPGPACSRLSSAPKVGATHSRRWHLESTVRLSSAPKVGATHSVMPQRIANISRISVPLP